MYTLHIQLHFYRRVHIHAQWQESRAPMHAKQEHSARTRQELGGWGIASHCSTFIVLQTTSMFLTARC